MASITSANATLTMTVASLFTTPVQLTGFAVDDIYDIDPMECVETMMGVDGVLYAGFVFVPIKQKIALQADSNANPIFDAWWQGMQTQRDVYFAQMTLKLPSTGIQYSMQQGVMTSYQPIPNAKKVLQPRTHTITWQGVGFGPIPAGG